MSKAPILEIRIRSEIQCWFDTGGVDFVLNIKEFCQGNRASLTRILEMVKDLSARVFLVDGQSINQELLENLEYGIFDLIGKFSSTPGDDDLQKAIRENIVDYLTDIFSETKKQWNLNQYKMTSSFEELDPGNSLIPDSKTAANINYNVQPEQQKKNAQHQAKDILNELVVFAKNNFRGKKKQKIAVNWLENPEKIQDFSWLSSLVESSTGSTKVILTRIKHSFAREYNLKTQSNKLVLIRSDKVSS